MIVSTIAVAMRRSSHIPLAPFLSDYRADERTPQSPQSPKDECFWKAPVVHPSPNTDEEGAHAQNDYGIHLLKLLAFPEEAQSVDDAIDVHPFALHDRSLNPGAVVPAEVVDGDAHVLEWDGL